MNLGEVKRVVREMVGDDDGALLGDSFLTWWVNLAQRDIVKRTECLEGTYSVAAVTTTQGYTLPTDLMMLKRVSVNGVRLDPITMAEADSLSGDVDETGFTFPAGSACYYIWNSKIYVTAEQNSGNLVIQYIKYPTALDSDDDLLTIPPHMEEDLIHRVISDSRTRTDEPDLALSERGRYEVGVAKSADLDSWQGRESYPAVRLVPGDG